MSVPYKWLETWNQNPIIDRPIRVIGIDLGTTNSTITEIVWSPISDQVPVARLLQVPQDIPGGQYVFDLVPSVVANYEGHTYVGTGAQRLRASTNLLARNKDIWWDTKNEIGTRRVYGSAADGFKTPKDIARQILEFLNEAALDANAMPIDRVVVTVPASFQLTQRQDTIEAAKDAGISLQGQDLLAEPVAAFLDFLTLSEGAALSAKKINRVMVVDFGGGTCDIALLQLTKGDGGELGIANKGVSRFHRIGGSDIDDVLAYEVLLPELLKQNEIKPFELNYKQKRDNVLPVLTSVAEVLKKKLSDKVNMQKKLGQFDETDGSLAVSLPAPTQVNTGHEDYGVISLNNPTLTLDDTKQAVGRFLNIAWLRPEEGEYFQATSIFAPINDCLSRAGWTKEHVDHILLVGGSSLYYGVSEALIKSFPDANLLTYGEPLDAQRCVGRGAAIQALLLTAYGTSPLKPTIGDEVTINSTTGWKTLIESNTALPFPNGTDWQSVPNLVVAGDSSKIDFEFKTGDRALHSQAMFLPEGAIKGTPIDLAIRVDENQRFRIRMSVAGVQQEVDLDNPFSVTANPNADRDRILELEELVIQADSSEKRADLIGQIAGLHHKLGERERARQLYEGLLATAEGTKTGRILHMLGLICGEMHDVEAQVAYYREAISKGFSGGIAFNLALQLGESNHADEALEIIDTLIDSRSEGPDHSLRGLILKALDRPLDALEAFQVCIDQMHDLEKLNDFEIGWLTRAARETQNEDLLLKLAELRKARQLASMEEKQNPTSGSGTALPSWND